MRSCRRLNACATLFSGLLRNEKKKKKEKKEEKREGEKNVSTNNPLSGLFDSRPVTCVSSFRQPRSRDEKAILEGISSVYRLFSHFFLSRPSFSLQLAWRKAQFPNSLSLSFFLCFARKFMDCSR